MNFKVTGLPLADSYSIAVGRRGEIRYSYADMQKANWTVALTLG